MIELLSRLDPATSPYIGQMQDSGEKKLSEKDQKQRAAAKNLRCRVCRGKKKVKMPVDEHGVRKYETCPNCFGSGVKLGENHKSSRSRAQPKILTPEQIAGLTQGMDEGYFRAAMVFVNHDLRAHRMLIEDVRKRIVSHQSGSWRLSDDLRSVRSLGLSRVAVGNLILPRGDYMGKERGSLLMCCTEQSWEKTWLERALDISQRVEGWVASADSHMVEMQQQGYDELNEMSA